ncbi:MAG: DUF4870 domain-containing protein [Bacillota bacterium]
MGEEGTSLGLDENIAGALCYLLGWLTGVFFLFAEQDSEFVRFHAIQSIVVFLSLNVVAILIGIVPIIGLFLSPLLSLFGLVLGALLIYKAYQGDKFELPVFSEISAVKDAKEKLAELAEQQQ